jgi:tetratricopeptide (TPR) repeat protein
LLQAGYPAAEMVRQPEYLDRKNRVRMASTLSPSEEAQLAQTIEMFEVITQSQPHDYQSLEILKEAYSKLNREQDVVSTSKRIAQAYVQMGQLSSAILEYETILQRYPDDPDVQAALQQIESKANNFPLETAPSADTILLAKAPSAAGKGQKTGGRTAPADIEDGRHSMHKLFVESKIITAGDVVEPFIQILADKGVLPVDKSLKMLSDKSRFAFLPLNSYDIDMDLTRKFPVDTCQRWCVLPFDRMSKSILVATVNPFNQQAAKELAEATPNRLLWYLVPPVDLIANLRKAFR